MKINILTALVALFVFPSPALAYIDPGVGSVFLQAIGVVFIAVSTALAVFRNRIASFFKKGKRVDPVNNGTEGAEKRDGAEE